MKQKGFIIWVPLSYGMKKQIPKLANGYLDQQVIYFTKISTVPFFPIFISNNKDKFEVRKLFEYIAYLATLTNSAKN